MATKTVGTFAKECRRFSTRIEDATVKGVNRAALDVTTGIRKELRRVVPDSRLSGTRNNAKLSVGYKGAKPGKPTALISAQGPWPLIESDMPRHGEPKQPKLTKSGRARKNFRTRKVLKIPGIGFRRVVNHPGTKGQHPFRNGVYRTIRTVPFTITEAIADEMERVFG